MGMGILLGGYKVDFDLADWLFEHVSSAKSLAAGQLVFLGVAATLIVGW